MSGDLFSVALPVPITGTTAKYPNRARDKDRVEALKGWAEQGNPDQLFYTHSQLFAQGYRRIVYGDHGPYLEFSVDHLQVPLVSHFDQKVPKSAYYEWMDVKGDARTKVYAQLKSVADLPNPPAGGFRGNRAEGYADYVPGFFYVSVWELFGELRTEGA